MIHGKKVWRGDVGDAASDQTGVWTKVTDPDEEGYAIYNPTMERITSSWLNFITTSERSLIMFQDVIGMSTIKVE